MVQTKEEIAAYRKAYHQANKGKRSAENKAYREANKEQIAAKRKIRYEATRDQRAPHRKAYYHTNRERIIAYKGGKHAKDLARNATLKRKYGITLDDYNRMFEEQGMRCKICGIDDPGAWNLDHCHTTGKVRGILCVKCNTSLGKIEKDPALFQRMMDYIEEHK